MQSERCIGSELARFKFKDERHGKRLRKLLEQLSDKIGGTIPLACQDWANTKAEYRFFSNDRVSEREILAGHFQATRDRLAATNVLMLVLHDTTEFTFHRSEVGSVGILHKSYMRKNKRGAPCCVHIGDLESDIYELFCIAQQAGTHFLLRTCVDRVAGDRDHTIADEMKEVRVQGLHRIQVRIKREKSRKPFWRSAIVESGFFRRQSHLSSRLLPSVPAHIRPPLHFAFKYTLCPWIPHLHAMFSTFRAASACFGDAIKYSSVHPLSTYSFPCGLSR